MAASTSRSNLVDNDSDPRNNFDKIESERVGCLHASKGSFRFVVLFFNCMLTFGSYFCFDMPSVLQDEFEAPLHPNNTCNNNNSLHNGSSHNGSCSHQTSGLGLTSTEYNLLYSIYAWTNALVVIGAGYLIDKLGNRVGCFLFSSLCVLGSSIFALAIHFKGQSAMLPLLLLGRLIFGSGNGSLTIVQNRISAYWFAGKELALAFGCTLAFSRLGSVLNFFLTQRFCNKFGMGWTLWGGAMLCGLGFLAAMVVSLLDKIGLKQQNKTDEIHSRSKRMRFSDITHFTAPFWFLLITLMFFYNGVFPFVADASKFISDQYNIANDTAPLIAGAVYDVSMVASPFMGTIVDQFGHRGVLASCCGLLTIPVFGFLAFARQIPPLVSTIWLGCTYSVAAACLWPSIPLVIDQSAIGTAMGITTSVQMIGIGLCNLVVGAILDHTREDVKWKYVMIFLLGNMIACVVFSVLLNLTDNRKGGILNKTTKKRRRSIYVNPPRTSGESDPVLRGNPKTAIN